MRLKYKKLLLLFTMGIFGIGMVTISFQVSPDALQAAFIKEGDRDSLEPTSSPDSQAITPTAFATNTPIPENPNALKKDAYPEINELIETYYKAKVSTDANSIEILKNCVTDASLLDFERISKKVEYITDYKNFHCYSKPGTGEIDYIVYVCYDIMITKIQTGAPSADVFYITYQDGKPHIFLGNVSQKTKNYIDKTNLDEDVQKLSKEVDDNLAKAIEMDEDLREFYENLTAQTSNVEPSETPAP
ncbi:hypothetical protein [Lachnoclostridium phytofermentans]|uniref:Uncharacterized protein n=1 Tax=Lachnoclostridium phytofermentans (strain ATCC 700394 / DSM 18823 / ISDg) TaxID=357809 RepID=A9KPL3_LACP7|nr:hypothetical protein [Lachnoclostridium phytofermentans]ABX43287.1 hypothetical protein Cphy_2930 [Lachnoclostridium phytofermentans ISDg]